MTIFIVKNSEETKVFATRKLAESWANIIRDAVITEHEVLNKTNEERFFELANEISANPDWFKRKLSKKDLRAYDNGDDPFGDIVNWAERQLEMCEDVDDLIEDSNETRDEWFGYELYVLEMLVKENRIKV